MMVLQLRNVPTHRDDTALVEASGPINTQHVHTLDDHLAALVEDGKRHLVLDLANVSYVNSTGFGVLIKHAQALDKVDGGLSLLGISAKVRVVIDMLGLEQVFTCVCKRRPARALAA